MGMYYNRLIESSDVEDVIQTPDNVGVDLDAIEDAIMGDDGIEAHRSEIEDASKGLVGDPLEEAMFIMYESEYNLNQLMNCIGIAELSEFMEGRDFVLESVNLKAFLQKTRDVLIDMFKKFTNVVKDFIDKVSEKISLDKNLVKKYEKEIRSGFSNGEWTIDECYDMDALKAKYCSKNNRSNELYSRALTDIKNGHIYSDSENAMSNQEIMRRVLGDNKFNGTASGDMITYLNNKYYKTVNGGYTNSKKPDDLCNTVIEVLTSSEIKDMKEAYNKIKENYKSHIKMIEKLMGDEENSSDKNSVCTKYATAITYEQNAQQLFYTHSVKALKTRRSQARRMALMWIRSVKNIDTEKPAEEEDVEEEPVEEAAALYRKAISSINII